MLSASLNKTLASFLPYPDACSEDISFCVASVFLFLVMHLVSISVSVYLLCSICAKLCCEGIIVCVSSVFLVVLMLCVFC